MPRNALYIILITFIFIECTGNVNSPVADTPKAWHLVYRNDNLGNTVFGNKATLIAAVRNGYPMRIGFGGRRPNDTTKSVEHLVDAHFLTIANGNEVFAQIQPIIGQHPLLEKDTLGIIFRENLEWTILVGTNGFSDRLTTDKFADTIVNHRSRFMDVSWFVYSFRNENNDKLKPLW